MSSLLTAFHCIATIINLFTCYYIFAVFSLPKTEPFRMFHNFGGELRFLTNWDMIVQSVFFVLCLTNDFIGTNDILPRKTPTIRRVKDFYHASLGFPLAAFVSVTFWVLYAIDRELVFPRALDPYFPLWLNHLLHTNILLLTLVEMFCSFRAYPSRKKGLGVLTGFLAVYIVWLFIIYGMSGRWVYPVMEVLNWPQRFLFIVGLLSLSLAFYLAGEKLNKLVWKKEWNVVESSKKVKGK